MSCARAEKILLFCILIGSLICVEYGWSGANSELYGAIFYGVERIPHHMEWIPRVSCEFHTLWSDFPRHRANSTLYGANFHAVERIAANPSHKQHPLHPNTKDFTHYIQWI